ncbi:MAG: MBOAT family protein, partial [Thermoguttaceae bacterium]|nr:MBOAT family protein [Thermoguttaceae bacterium]
MIFNSLAFAAFILVVGCVLVIFNAKPFLQPERAATAARLRHGVLLVASYVFCGWFDWRFCLALAATTAVVYFCALGVARGKRSKLWLRLGVVLPLVALAVFKYFNFFVSSVASALSLDVEALGTLKIILPIGISFYVFQAISYVVDVNRGKVEASSDFVKVALYLAFFPRLVSGPIVKAAYFFPQLEEKRNVGLKNLEIGVQIFALGLFKKIVVADRLGAFVDTVYATPNAFHGAVVTLAVVTYALQLYFDFSGYSDMAVGVAKGLGYDLPRNFNLPYLSRNPSELWKRWHISLSSW